MSALDAGYAAAVYRFELGGRSCAFVFGRGPRPLDLSLIVGGRSWAIVTACNPQSRTLSDAENHARTGALRVAIERLGLEHGRSESSDIHGCFREPGFVIVNISRQATLALARQFDQRAVVFGLGNSVGLLNTWTERWSMLPASVPKPWRAQPELG